MKNLTNISLLIVLFLATAFASCKKGSEANPDDPAAEHKNSVQLFLNDNSGVALEGNDAVTATYADGKLKVIFSQNGIETAIEIPNYDINAAHSDYNNTNAAFSLKDAKEYNSGYIYVPAIVGNPPHPVFVIDKSISIKTANLKVDPTTTDIAIQIVSGSELITVPVSNGATAVYSSIGFVQGAGGKPNMINLRIKQ